MEQFQRGRTIMEQFQRGRTKCGTSLEGGENNLREIVKVRESLNINLREIIELD